MTQSQLLTELNGIEGRICVLLPLHSEQNPDAVAGGGAGCSDEAGPRGDPAAVHNFCDVTRWRGSSRPSDRTCCDMSDHRPRATLLQAFAPRFPAVSYIHRPASLSRSRLSQLLFQT